MSDLLLVDNDRRIVDLVAFFLTKRGHVVRTAETFGAARAAILDRRPDLMLSDLDLGRERGDEELPRLASEGRLPPTLVVSGYLDATLERTLLAIPGVMGTLRKPFDLSALEARIGDALERARPLPVPATPARAAVVGDAAAGDGSARDAAARDAAARDDAEAGWVDIGPFGSNASEARERTRP